MNHRITALFSILMLICCVSVFGQEVGKTETVATTSMSPEHEAFLASPPSYLEEFTPPPLPGKGRSFLLSAPLNSGNFQFFGPTPYLLKSNSPFNTTAPGFILEDFEDHRFNPPGVTVAMSPGVWTYYPPRGDRDTDSVDGDDGALDGYGRNGGCWWFGGNSNGSTITFTFNQSVIGYYPKEAGLVWTDGYHVFTFYAYDATGAFLGQIGPVTLGVRGQYSGETAEDRFFGVSCKNGISKIVITTSNSGLEIDHFQYGSGKTNEVLNISAIPGTLFLDKGGVGSGIVFRATTSEAGTVNFRVRNPAGEEISIGSAATESNGSENVAKVSWWGSPGLAPGQYTIIAEVDGSIKESAFTVQALDVAVTGYGNWVPSKDPGATVPELGDPNECKLGVAWDEIPEYKAGVAAAMSVADPVGITLGNFIHSNVDLMLKGRQKLTLARIYNSLDPHIGGFGRGWSSPYFSRLELADGNAVFINSDGSRVFFQNQNGVYVGPEGTDLKLSYSADTAMWTLSHPYGTEWNFDDSGKLIRTAKSCCGQGPGDAITFDYDGNGRLHRVTGPTGDWLEFTWNGNGFVTLVADSTGRTVHYTITADGLLTGFTDVAGRVTAYAYNEDQFLTEIRAPGDRVTGITYDSHRVTSVTEPTGETSRFVWDYDTPKMTLTDTQGINHEYVFNSDWKVIGYRVPSLNLEKTFNVSGALLTGYQNSLGAQETFHFNHDGFIDTKTDALGNTSQYEYHPTFHRLTKRTDPLGRMWEYTWCSRGNLKTEKNPAGGTISYTYDSHNNRTGKTDPLGRVSRWVYDSNGKYLVQSIDPAGGVSSFTYDLRGNLLTSTDPLGRITSFQYDLLDRLTKTIYPDGRFVEIEYDEAGNIAIRRDQLGRETTYAYDLGNHLITLSRPDHTTFSYTYNPAGQKISETDPLGRITRFEYNPIGLLTKTVYPDNTFESFTYDTEKRLLSKTDEGGNSTSFEYDVLGRLLAAIDPTGARWESQYDAGGRKTFDKDPLQRGTSYQYDVLDRLTKVTRADGSFITNTFDAVGNILTTIDALSNTWTWEYDTLDRQVKAIQPNGAVITTRYDAAGQITGTTDALGGTTEYAYDNGGRRVSTTDALGNIWRNFYDNSGRLIGVADPLGAVSSMTYDLLDRMTAKTNPLGNTNHYEFDAGGHLVAKIDALGRRSITVYDQRDRVTSEVDPEGRMVSYAYNPAGQRVSLTDGNNRIWRWEYDALGRMLTENEPIGNTVTNGYDATGNRVSRTNARNETTTYQFDVMNRLVQVNYPNGSVATLAYDLEGREIFRSGNDGTVGKTYDAVGNTTSETFGPWDKTWTYQYDLAGNRIGAVDPEGGKYCYSYDLLNRLTKLDPPGKAWQIEFAYDAAGRMISEDRGSTKTINVYDKAGQLLELKHERGRGSEKVIASRKYDYDAIGNRTVMETEDGNKTAYQYNSSDWLTNVAYPNGQQVTYLYNGAGDRIEEKTETPTVTGRGKKTVIGTDTQTISFGYDSAGKMVTRGADIYGYDPDGNLITAVENGEETRFAWTSDNRLAKVEREVGCQKHRKKHCHQCRKTFIVAEEYSYLPEDWRRIGRKIGEETFVSTFDQNDESGEYLLKLGSDSKGKEKDKRGKGKKPYLDLVREFIGGPGTDDIAGTKYHGRYLNMLKDGLGSTIALTNRGGHAVAEINYDAFGNFRFPDKPGHGVKPCDEKDLGDWLDRFDVGRSFGFQHDAHHWGRHFGKVLTPYLYTGRRWDGFSQTYNNRNRQMNPKYGRFTSRDPIGFRGDLNLYRYAANNPLAWADPFGLKKVLSWLSQDRIEEISNTANINYLSMGPAYNPSTGTYEQEKVLKYADVDQKIKEIVSRRDTVERAFDNIALEYWKFKLWDDEDACFKPVEGTGPHKFYYLNTTSEGYNIDVVRNLLNPQLATRYLNKEFLYKVSKVRSVYANPVWVDRTLVELEKLCHDFEANLLK